MASRIQQRVRLVVGRSSVGLEQQCRFADCGTHNTPVRIPEAIDSFERPSL